MDVEVERGHIGKVISRGSVLMRLSMSHGALVDDHRASWSKADSEKSERDQDRLTCSIGSPAAATKTSSYSSSPSISLNPSNALTSLVLALNNLPQISELSSGFSSLHFKIPLTKDGVFVPASTSAKTSLNPLGNLKGWMD